MKRIFGYIACAVFIVLFAGCGGDGVRFTVKCSGLAPRQTYYLTPSDDTRHYYLKGKSDGQGRIGFRGTIEHPVYANICNSLGARVVSFYVEQGTVKIDCGESGCVVQGTPSNDAYRTYMLAADSILAWYLAQPEATTEMAEAYERQIDSLDEALWQNNTDKILGLYLFTTEQINVLSDAELAEWSERFAPRMQQHPYMNAVREKLNSEKKISEKE